MSQILLVNREPNTLNILSRLFKTEGYKVTIATDSAVARNLLKNQTFNLMVCDVGPGGQTDRIELMKDAEALRAGIPIVAIVDIRDPKEVAVMAPLKVFAQVDKPLKVDKLLATVQKAVDYDESLKENVNLNLQLETRYQYENVVAESAAMKSACDMISRVSATDITVLLVGEPGTGRGILAATLHEHSRRKNKPFLRLDCASDSDVSRLLDGDAKTSAIFQAQNGTLFLANIDRLSLTSQAFLQKVLQERKAPGNNEVVDVRLIASTILDLEVFSRNGQFNADLYRLLRIIQIRIPPLRERKEDILPLMRNFLQRSDQGGGALPILTPDVVEALETYTWPGNATEMQRVVHFAMKHAGEGKITPAHLPPEITGRT